MCAAFEASSLPDAALLKAVCSALERNVVYALSSAAEASSSSELDEKSSRSWRLLSRGFLLVGA